MFEDLFVDTHKVLVELSIIPMGRDGQRDGQFAELQDIFVKSGLFCEYLQNSACIEGDWSEISPLIYVCYERVKEQFPQGFLTVSIR